MSYSADTSVVDKTKEILESVYKASSYEEELKQEAQQTFSKLSSFLPAMAKSADGQKLVTKFTGLGSTALTEGMFQDMVKIIWRMIKDAPAQNSVHRFGLFLLAIGATCHSCKAENKEEWQRNIEKWLGIQVTIGGKGCTGDGEGNVADRMQRFFSTPYLHDFD